VTGVTEVGRHVLWAVTLTVLRNKVIWIANDPNENGAGRMVNAGLLISYGSGFVIHEYLQSSYEFIGDQRGLTDAY